MSLLQTLRQAGFRGDALRTAYAVAMAESGGRATAYNPDAATGDNSYGLFQINMLGDLGPARLRQFGLSRNEDLFDPLTNARVAFRMSGGGRDWSPWSAYKNGAYKKYLAGAPGTGKLAGPTQAAQVGEQAFATSGAGMQYFKRQAATFFMAQAQAAAAGKPVDFTGLFALGQMRQQMTEVPAPAPAPTQAGAASAGAGLTAGSVRELFHDPLGAYDEGTKIAPIGGHGKHVHAAFRNPQAAVAAIRLAQGLGLRVSENPFVDKVDPVHTGGSLHYQTFPGKVDGRVVGQGLDVSGSSDAMAQFFNTLRSYATK